MTQCFSGPCVSGRHRRVRCLGTALRNDTQTVQEISLQIGKSKEVAIDKQYIAVWKIFWTKRLLNSAMAYQEG